jgi:polyisoprenoid-binding protein YceI
MSLRSVLLRSAVTLGGLCFSLAIAAAALKADPAKSSFSIVFKQLNVPIEAKFNKATMQVSFDSAKPETAQARVEIDIASFDLGDPEYNAEVLKKEWFNAAQFPKATFVSSAMTAVKGGRGDTFNVTGKLTIKGKTADVAFPLTVKKEGAAQVFEGTLPIKRLAFGIGEGEWKDTSVLADEVLIKFRVFASQ